MTTMTESVPPHRKAWDWNEKHPIGTTVSYRPVVGASEHTVHRTRTRAQVLGGHTAVIWLEGKTGCIALDAIEALQDDDDGEARGLAAAEEALVGELLRAAQALREGRVIGVNVAVCAERIEVDFYRAGFDLDAKYSTPIDSERLLCRVHE